MLTQATVLKLQELKLSGMVEAYEEIASSTKGLTLTIDEGIGLLADREDLHRKNRVMTRRLKSAKLRENALIEDIDWRHKRNLDKANMLSLSSCDWIDRHQNLIFVGQTGLGKTWLACALGQRACTHGKTTLFVRIPRLFGLINESRVDGSYERYLSSLSKANLLILDDWGQALTEQERRDFREIIEDRYDRGSIIITTQLPVDRWHEVIGDPTIADAIVDRIVNRAHKVTLSGDSMRRKKGSDKEGKTE